jgi:ADP-L-glycero-D-manno-heptose 6-epimerase
MKKTIVTGAAGMIGSGVVRYLNDQGNSDLILVDDLKSGEKWKNLVGKQFIDILSKHALFEWLKGKEGEVDAIIHLGACSDTVETNVDYLLENNFRYTVRLAEWAVKHGIRFIYASSAATYGDGAFGFNDDESQIERLRPLNPYAFSKQMADLWMKREGFLGKVAALKYFNVFGPNEYHKGRMSSMVLKMSQKVELEGEIHLYKSNEEKYPHGGQMRDFVYLKDAVRMTCALLEPKYRGVCGIFNIGQGKPTTWNRLAESLFRALGKEIRIHYIDMPQELLRQYQNYTCASMDKFHKIFSTDPNYTKTMSIEPAVEEYVQEYLIRSARW